MNIAFVRLGDIAPARPIRKKITDDSLVKWQLNLDQVEAQTGRVLEHIRLPVGEAGSSTHWFGPEHVLYSKLRPYLNKVVIPEEEGIATTELVPLLPDPDRLDRRYFAHYLRSRRFVSWVSSQVAGAKMPRVSMKVFWDHEIPLPSLPEQKRIAKILDKAEFLRQKRQLTIELIDKFQRSVFLEMFGDLVSNPRKWNTVKIDDMITRGPTNGIYKPASEYGEGCRILRIDGFYDGKLNDDATFKRVRLSEDEITKYRLVDGSIVINRVNSREYLGKCALIEGLCDLTVFESNIMNFTVNQNVAIPRFVVDQLCSPYVRGQILKNCKDAVNQSSINQQDVKSIQIRLPPMNLQRKYEEVVKHSLRSVQRMRAQLNDIQLLYHATANSVFSGSGAEEYEAC